MNFSVPSFDQSHLKQICEALADTSTGLTGWDIQQLLKQLGFEDPTPQAPNKRARLLDALLLEQQRRGSGYPVLLFIEEVMKPVNYTQRPAQFESRRQDLNSVLAFAGYVLGLDGTIHPRDAVTTLSHISPVIATGDLQPPSEIINSLNRFRTDHPDASKAAFIMMRFAHTEEHREIAHAIKEALRRYGIKGLRADDKEYHDDLFPNVLTYMYGCRFGIAVFERIDSETHNPNVALEVGYMLALGKPVCLLKDQTLTTLQADLVGKLYKPFSTRAIATSIPEQVEKWLTDRGLT